MAISSIATNFAANSAGFYVNRANSEIADSVTRLSSGNASARPSDNIGALSVGKQLQSQLSGMYSALTNANQGSSMLQVASSGIEEIISILEEQSALAIQSQSGSLTDAERGFLNLEFQELADEIDQIANSTVFNNINLLNGGLGTTVGLFSTDALAAAFDPSGADINSGFSDASTVSIQAFDQTDGTSRDGTGTAGFLEAVDAGDTKLADDAFATVHGSVYGKFSDFTISDVTYGVSGTLTAKINGVEFSGTFAHNDTAVTVQNGSTYLRLGTTALDVTDDGTTAIAEAQLGSDFADTVILRTGVVSGVDFTDTRLEDAIGTGTTPLASLRLASNEDNISISNFEYAGNAGADANVLTVQINGETFTATGVTDTIDDGTATLLTFEKGNGEALVIDITGLTGGTNTAINDIRTDMNDRQQFVDALNVGFSRAGGGLVFNVSGNSSYETIEMQIDSANTCNLYGGQSLDIATTGTAATAEMALDDAMDIALTVQAQIGALQERFDYAGSALESGIIGIDEARGNLLDTDITTEATNLATQQVLLQAGVAALAQANLMQGTLLDMLNND